jgi:hypothetical protein
MIKRKKKVKSYNLIKNLKISLILYLFELGDMLSLETNQSYIYQGSKNIKLLPCFFFIFFNMNFK